MHVHNCHLLYSWRFSRYRAPIHWLVHGHMTFNNETVSRQMPMNGRNLVPRAFSSTIFKMADRREKIRHFENRRRVGPGDEVVNGRAVAGKTRQLYNKTSYVVRLCYASYRLCKLLSQSKSTSQIRLLIGQISTKRNIAIRSIHHKTS